MILRKFEAAGTANLNFTGRGVAQTSSGDSGAGRIVYETPVLNVMGRELSSLTELQSTLAQKGLSGSCLIRLSFRKTDIPLQEAMEEIKQYMKSVEEPVAPGPTSASVADTQSTPSGEAAAPSPDDVSGEPTPTRSDTTPIDPPPSSTPSSNEPPVLTPRTPSEASTPSDTIFGPNQRPITVFAAPNSHTPQAALNPHNESDYEPTVAHAKLHQQSLQNRSHNQRLLSDAELQRQNEERAAKQAAIKDVTIKVRFPDQLSVVSSFTALDSGASLYEFVRGVIVAEDQPFALVWSSSKGPQTIPNDNKVTLIRDLGFAGRMLVNFNWAEGASEDARSRTTLKDAFASTAKELQVQQIAAAEVQDQEDQAASAAEDEEKKTSGSGSGKSKGGVPKWLKLPGKK
jgi:tether containing UBX domain for GLUT4